MMYIRTLLYALLAATIFSCTPNLRVVSDEYKTQKFVEAHLAVKAIPSQLFFIENIDDVKDDIAKEGIPEEVFSLFFREEFGKAIQKYSTYNTVTFLANVDSTKLERSEFHIDSKNTVNFNIPSIGFKYNVPENCRFVLIFPALRIHRYGGKAPMFIPGPNGGSFSGGEGPSLIFNIDYLLWDNVRSKPVSFGKLEINNPFMLAMTKETWVSTINSLARAIIQGTAFEKQMYGGR